MTKKKKDIRDDALRGEGTREIIMVVEEEEGHELEEEREMRETVIILPRTTRWVAGIVVQEVVRATKVKDPTAIEAPLVELTIPVRTVRGKKKGSP